MSTPKLYQTTRAQDWALHELARGVRPSEATSTRTLRSLMRAGLAVWAEEEWSLTKAGEREAWRATKRLQRRSA